ncbi:hypothetical protein [Cystobacter fuscus]|uniref:hypothetical protein n=1 Tax=Cystobacter fuscus TaxID=43 RepID=UPI0037BEF6C4
MLAPSTATYSFATRTSPLTDSWTSIASPLKSMKHFSPARCSCRMVVLTHFTHRA